MPERRPSPAAPPEEARPGSGAEDEKAREHERIRSVLLESRARRKADLERQRRAGEEQEQRMTHQGSAESGQGSADLNPAGGEPAAPPESRGGPAPSSQHGAGPAQAGGAGEADQEHEQLRRRFLQERARRRAGRRKTPAEEEQEKAVQELANEVQQKHEDIHQKSAEEAPDRVPEAQQEPPEPAHSPRQGPDDRGESEQGRGEAMRRRLMEHRARRKAEEAAKRRAFSQNSHDPEAAREEASPSALAAGADHTIRLRSSRQPLRLFCAWFCPYSQRAWIALEEKGAEYEYVPVDPYCPDADRPGGSSKRPLPFDEKCLKYPDFVGCSPRGLVPALENRRGNGKIDRVHDSMVCVEYIDEACRGPPLLPTGDPGLRAHVRAWCGFVNEHVIPHFRRLLSERGARGREEAKALLIEGLAAFAEAMAPIRQDDEGDAYFLGDTFSMADIALCPWWFYFPSVGSAHCGLEIPPGGIFHRLQAWGEACGRRPSVMRTTADRERLIENYSGYMDL